MKRLSMLMFAVLFSFLTVNAQENLKVETFYLDNGLKVVLCEDHSAPTILGTVYVHAGSKNDPLDATGMAHWFESSTSHESYKGLKFSNLQRIFNSVSIKSPAVFQLYVFFL
ncbi:MAG: insulinase family protein, partial [Lentimicrobiaceae bacterium]|nr:insulinase family protein [Lentimicrobiaceae bacterium]